jgi:hypothetical protein
MARLNRHPRRRGSLIPLLAVSAISLFAFVALSVDLGMLAVSRTECQNAADSSALVGCRTLNNKVGVMNSNLAQAVANAKATAMSNYHLSTNFTNAQIAKVETGQYLYDPTNTVFTVLNWTDVTNSQGTTPPSGSWTAIRVTMSVTQPTYFMKVFGVTTMPTGAVATAVYRPRDIAFVLDMTGSMGYASQFNYNGSSHNPDDLIPSFGHYVSIQNRLRATQNQANADGEAISMNNVTVSTSGGPPLVRNFYFDPANVANPTNSAFPITTAGGAVVTKNAFHRWSPPESGGNPATATPVVYDFTGYDPTHKGTEATPKGPTPAPGSYGTMTDSGTITYAGDRYRRANGSINKTDTTWATGTANTKAAATAAELLGYKVSNGNIQKPDNTTIAAADRFRDPTWEALGYDLDIVAYRTAKTANAENPLNPGAFTTTQTDNPFVGYSMGPGYWGKTFWIWPPDPRAPVGNPGDAGYKPGDWRRRFFKQNATTAFNPQSGTLATRTIDGQLFATGSNNVLQQGATPTFVIDYAAVLKWIKSGPQTLPPNLRAGRVLYYTSIPDSVDTTTTSNAQIKLDMVFWKNYIDFVFGLSDNNTKDWDDTTFLFGLGDSWTASARDVSTADTNTWNGPSNNWTPTNQRPYMRYADSPNRPRLHFWFGPLSIISFLHRNVSEPNWLPGTCSEAQCWQLKAGMNSVIDDLRNNHPNDYAGLVMFTAPDYNDIRRPMGQNYQSLKNALFYPKSLLNAIDGGDVASEFRPYDLNFNDVSADQIPNASGSTDPNTGLAYGFNLLSPSASLGTQYGTVKGRRGSSKVIIFETDGVPNTYRGNNGGTGMTPTLKGYDTYYMTSEATNCSGNVGNDDLRPRNRAIDIAKQFAKQMSSANTNGADSGLSLPNAPARIYPIAFGDLFDTVASPNADFRDDALQFLANVAAAGYTGPSTATVMAPGSTTFGTATTIPDIQICTGPYQQRITRLKDCMQRIFQSGVSVALIE